MWAPSILHGFSCFTNDREASGIQFSGSLYKTRAQALLGCSIKHEKSTTAMWPIMKVALKLKLFHRKIEIIFCGLQECGQYQRMSVSKSRTVRPIESKEVHNWVHFGNVNDVSKGCCRRLV